MLLSQSLLNRFAPPKEKNAADFAEAYSYLPDSDANRGKFHCRPYQYEMLKAMSIGGNRMYANGAPINEVVVMKSVQVGYTQILFNAIGYHIHQRPCAIGFYVPTSETANVFGVKYFAKWLAAQPHLQSIVSAKLANDGTSSTTTKLFPGGYFSILSANKSSDVASSSMKLVAADEIDLYLKQLKGEGSPIDLIRNRAQEHADKLVIFGSSPRGTFEESTIFSLYEKSDKRKFYIKCPHCGHEQYLAWEQFRPNPKNDYKESGFECLKCRKLFYEKQKSEIISQGRWKPTKNPDAQPGRCGFHIWQAYSCSPNTTWPEMARRYLACNHDSAKKIDFFNNVVGLPSRERPKGTVVYTEITAQKSKGTHHLMELPPEVSMITIGVDNQTSKKYGRLEYSIWGYGPKGNCYFLGHEIIEGDPSQNEVWEELDLQTTTEFVSADGKRTVPVSMLFIDSRGGANQKVYEVCRTHRGPVFWYPIVGISNYNKSEMVVLSQTGQQPRQPLYQVNTVPIKNHISDLIHDLAAGNPDAKLHIPKDLTNYVAMGWVSEYKQVSRTGRVAWTPIPSMKNEPLDCFVYSYAARTLLLSGQNEEMFWQKLEAKSMGEKPLVQRRKARTYGGIDFGA